MASKVDGEFQWLAGQADHDQQQFEILHQGYLNLNEEDVPVPSGSHEPGQAAAASLRRTSDPSIKTGWKKRYCILSQTSEGIHLLHYKHQSSFTKCETPCGVILLEQCTKLYENPRHPKSYNVLSVKFTHKILSLYPDKESELQQWLDVLQKALQLHEVAQLKGLPKQKAMRKDNQGTMRTNPKQVHIIYEQEQPDDEGKTVTCLSVKPLTDDKGENPKKLKGLPKQKALRSKPGHHGGMEYKDVFKDTPTAELETEGLSDKGIKFVGFKTKTM